MGEMKKKNLISDINPRAQMSTAQMEKGGWGLAIQKCKFNKIILAKLFLNKNIYIYLKFVHLCIFNALCSHT